jgi:hypothetical protein
MKCLLLAVSFVLAWAFAGAHAEPIVILTTGQSNMAYRIIIGSGGERFRWDPAKNARSWNWNFVDGHIGTAFTPLKDDSISLADRIASTIAKKRPDQTVYVINISFSGLSIAHWLPRAPAPDVFANILANVPKAFASIGATRIDFLVWWQGENPTGQPTEYPDHFDAVMLRLQAEPWFPRTTPVMIFGVAPSRISKNPDYDFYNGLLREAAGRSPNRQFFDTGILEEQYWLDAAHPNGMGFWTIGKMAAERLDGSVPITSVLRER